MQSFEPAYVEEQPVGMGRPSWIFWLLVMATAAAGFLLLNQGDSGWVAADDAGWFTYSPGLGIKLSIFLFVALGWVLSLTFHEFGHAFTAWKGGDHTVADKGYLNLDPRKYTDPGLSLVLPMVFLMLGGIGLPGGAVWIQTSLIKSKWMRSLMSAAGPISNVIFAILMLAPLVLGWVDESTHTALAVGLAFLGFLQITAFVLNMMPLPGLDGFGVIEPHLSRELAARLRPIGRNGFFILLGILWFVPPANRAFWSGLEWIFSLSGVDYGLVGEGFSSFKFWE